VHIRDVLFSLSASSRIEIDKINRRTK